MCHRVINIDHLLKTRVYLIKTLKKIKSVYRTVQCGTDDFLLSIAY